MGLRSGVEKSREKEPGDHHSKAAGRGRGYFKGQAVTVGAGEGANGRARGPRRRGRLALWGAITKKHKYSGRKEGWRRQTPIHPTPTRRLLLWVRLLAASGNAIHEAAAASCSPSDLGFPIPPACAVRRNRAKGFDLHCIILSWEKQNTILTNPCVWMGFRTYKVLSHTIPLDWASL